MLKMSAPAGEAGALPENTDPPSNGRAQEQNGSEKDAVDIPQDTPGDGPAKKELKSSNKFRLPWSGGRSQSDKPRSLQPLSAADPDEGPRRATFEAARTNTSPLGRHVSDTPSQPERTALVNRPRPSIDPKLRPEEEVYRDSRAATRREFRRRATTLQEYYHQNPTLLPQLPFTFRHGFKRWKLALVIVFLVFDACVVPIILYYAMTFGGHVEGWITFAVITTIWGGPAYFEFAIRSWRLILKERFFRPLGVSSRWAFDCMNWIFVVSITATTALLIIGAAPHIVWLRVLSMPGPALLLAIGGCLGLITIYNLAGWKAPFRLSSTPKGEKVLPGAYYVVEDIVAVNAGGGLPFREGLAARYEASPIFRKMLRDLSLFWSIGAVGMGAVLTVIVCIHSVKKEIAYGVGKHTQHSTRRVDRLTISQAGQRHSCGVLFGPSLPSHGSVTCSTRNL